MSFSHECGDSKINLSSAKRVQRVDEIHTGSTLTVLLDSITGVYGLQCVLRSHIHLKSYAHGWAFAHLPE